MAEIIRKEELDIVSLQEVICKEDSLDGLMHELKGWEKQIQDKNAFIDVDSKDRRGEGYAFIWNSRKFQMAKSDVIERTYEPRNVRVTGHDAGKMHNGFVRPPFYGRFFPVHGGFFELRLLNIHMFFGDDRKENIAKRKEEYDLFVNKLYPRMSERRYGNNRPAYTIAMGDYNLNLWKPRGELESQINRNAYIDNPVSVINDKKIVTVQDELTSLSSGKNNGEKIGGYRNNYDHFTFNVTALERSEIGYKYRRIDAIRKYYKSDFDQYWSDISDHVPIVMEIEMRG